MEEEEQIKEEEQNTKTAKEIQKCEKIMIGEPEFSLKIINVQIVQY